MQHTDPTAADPHLTVLFAALADPIRRQMVSQLSLGPATIGELSAPFAVSKPAISRHVRVLERAGLLRREKRGRHHWCELQAAPLNEVGEFVARTTACWNTQLDQLAAYVETDDARKR